MTKFNLAPTDVSTAHALLRKLDAAILDGNEAVAHEAHMAYDALVNSLNGGTNFGSYADEERAGNALRNALRASPGHTPLWGQVGSFLIIVDEISAYVEYGPSSQYHHIEFYAVRHGPFISETGYQSHFLSGKPAKAYAGKTVRETAIEVFTDQLKKSRKPIYTTKVYNNFAELPFVINVLGQPAPQIAMGIHVLIRAKDQIGLVTGQRYRTSPETRYFVTTLTTGRSGPQLVQAEFGQDEIYPLSPDQLAKHHHPGKYLTNETLKAMNSITTAERLA